MKVWFSKILIFLLTPIEKKDTNTSKPEDLRPIIARLLYKRIKLYCYRKYNLNETANHAGENVNLSQAYDARVRRTRNLFN